MLPLLGAALGGLGGLLSGSKKGDSAGNVYQLDPGQDKALLNDQINAMHGLGADPTAAVQGNAILGQTFGKGGTYDRTTQEEQNLASRGFSLQPEDYEAYGQASGNIARQFGQGEQSLAQSLSDRGLSNSGVAGAQFSGLQGNKMEQLGGLQRKIADDRMKMNLERLGQTRNFLNQLGSQANTDINSEHTRNQQTQQGVFDMSNKMLGNFQDQQNEQIQQQNQGSKPNQAGQVFSGMLSGAAGGASGLTSAVGSLGSMFKGGGGMSGNGAGVPSSDEYYKFMSGK